MIFKECHPTEQDKKIVEDFGQAAYNFLNYVELMRAYSEQFRSAEKIRLTLPLAAELMQKHIAIMHVFEQIDVINELVERSKIETNMAMLQKMLEQKGAIIVDQKE